MAPACGKGTRAATGLLFAVLLSACAPSRAPSSSGGSRLDILTAYTLALSKRDFRSALALVEPRERARLADSGGDARPGFRDRLRAMRLSTLVNHPRIQVEGGRISGIHDLLPVIEQAEAVFPADPGSVPAPAGSGRVPVPPRDEEKAALRRAAEALFASVRARKWDETLRLLDRREREAFQGPDGRLKENARGRLAAMDTTAWEALRLRDGKLTGVVLLIPARAPGPVL